MRYVITAYTQGSELAYSRILRADKAISSMAIVQEQIHRALTAGVMYQFYSGGPAVGGWRPASPQWIAYKQRHGLDPRTLHATLALRKSLTRASDPNHVWEVSPATMFMSTKLPYAAAQKKHGRNPAIIGPGVHATIVGIVRKAVEGAIK